ncbi:MAG: formyltransferase family protein, partial [Patescibacteria group bacterium]
THWIPSDFRSLPLGDTDNRACRKEKFEQQVLQLMKQRNTDVLISDHYMARIAYMIQNGYRKFGKVLNIHPAITQTGDPYCFRGPTPTQDAIDRARADGHARTGATLHFINEVIDDGPQISFVSGTPVYPHDRPQHLRYRNYQAAKLPLLVAGLRHYICNIYPHLDTIDVNQLTLLNGVSHQHS